MIVIACDKRKAFAQGSVSDDSFVMAGLDPAIHVFSQKNKTWITGTSPVMTR